MFGRVAGVRVEMSLRAVCWGGGEAPRRGPGSSQPAVTAHDQKRAQLVHLGTAAQAEGLSVTGKQALLGAIPQASPGLGAALGGAWHGCVARLSRGRWCVLQAMTRALAPCLAWHPPGSPAPRRCLSLVVGLQSGVGGGPRGRVWLPSWLLGSASPDHLLTVGVSKIGAFTSHRCK